MKYQTRAEEATSAPSLADMSAALRIARRTDEELPLLVWPEALGCAPLSTSSEAVLACKYRSLKSLLAQYNVPAQPVVMKSVHPSRVFNFDIILQKRKKKGQAKGGR
jgi:hypothetical protein